MSKPRLLALVWAALMVLLALSLVAWEFEAGIVIALAIAGMKAGLVVGVFMHLREESRDSKAVAASVLFWLMILFGFCAMDYFTRTM